MLPLLGPAATRRVSSSRFKICFQLGVVVNMREQVPTRVSTTSRVAPTDASRDEAIKHRQANHGSSPHGGGDSSSFLSPLLRVTCNEIKRCEMVK